MRTVTFSNDKVRKVLNDDFVCCYTDTTGDPTAGASFKHAPNELPGPCGRGAGRQNVQTIFTTPDGEIFHVAAGYVSPEELLDELKFAGDLFAKLTGNSEKDKPTVVAEHTKHLKQLGFTADQIAAGDGFMTDMFLSGPNPKDLGINFPGAQGTPFQDVDRQRILRDNKFVIANPLVTRAQFEQDPGSLVGHHKSFFGTNAAMNGVGEMFNGNLNQRRVVAPR